jgi:hypothetical protein
LPVRALTSTRYERKQSSSALINTSSIQICLTNANPTPYRWLRINPQRKWGRFFVRCANVQDHRPNPVEKVNATLYLPGPAGSEKKPLILTVGGYDSILEEKYPVIDKAALDRGYSILIYEEPGQGEPLRKYGVQFALE